MCTRRLAATTAAAAGGAGTHVHYCHCGMASRMGMARRPGPTQGRRFFFFFGCGSWTPARGGGVLLLSMGRRRLGSTKSPDIAN
ncbi:hypothetical protein GUJ93_ZPchr0011g28592 [Zizania palustris]|uniref:Uncharacterized protein n=1 Tax=Zizania palustris TaxID=103762 RepID=A0A8J5WK00_ZIZPA|nr:hypothetical protein GUJ93_ZPchr0011g28592 [Zizania palustris]